MEMKAEMSQFVKDEAKNLGFSACGIAPVRKLTEEEEHLKRYLDQNYHGKMGYMANHFEKRLDPDKLVPGAKSVIVVLQNYFPAQIQKGEEVPVIARYAYGVDYHFVVKNKLKSLLASMDQKVGGVGGRVFVDTAPVLERAWAVQAGLGWIGKNGLLINKNLGSFFYIAELVVDTELVYDSPFEKEYCGSCSQCLSACPTNALIKPYVLDSRKCISYQTIELKDTVDDSIAPNLNRRIFGCDICQEVCPWNRKIVPHNETELNPNPEFFELDNEAWKNMSRDRFNEVFRKSALKRAGFKKMTDNVKKAIGD